MRILIVLAAALLWTSPSLASDPECVPGDPAFIVPFDETSGPYLRPNRDVAFCTSTLPNPSSTLAMTCRVTVDGAAYAQTGAQLQRELVRLANPGVGAGSMETTCSLPGVDASGSPITITSVARVVDYDPTPVPGPPVPLEGAPPSSP